MELSANNKNHINIGGKVYEFKTIRRQSSYQKS